MFYTPLGKILAVPTGSAVTPMGCCTVSDLNGCGHTSGSVCVCVCHSQPGQVETGKREENRQISASTAAGVNVKQMGSSTLIILTS